MKDTEKLLRKLIVATALLASAALWWPAPASAMQLQPTSVAALPVAAQQAPFAQRGQRVDATVLSVEPATSNAAAR